MITDVNPLYLIIGKADGHIKENNGRKYSVFDSTDENREVLEKYTALWDSIKNETGNTEGEYGKDFMKIKFDINDNSPLNKLLKLCMLTVIVRSVFEGDSKFYQQIYLHGGLYEL